MQFYPSMLFMIYKTYIISTATYQSTYQFHTVSTATEIGVYAKVCSTLVNLSDMTVDSKTGSICFPLQSIHWLSGSDTGVHSSYANLEVTYDVQCQSESLRLTKHAKVMGMAVCPVGEGRVAILISDGRLVFLEMSAMHQVWLQGLVWVFCNPYKNMYFLNFLFMDSIF